MSTRRILALTLALLATACAGNGTQSASGLATGEDRLSADKSPAALLRIADATRAGGDPGSAIGLYQRAHEEAPKDPVPLARLGAAFAELRAYNEASAAYREAIKLAPNDPELRCGLATVLLAIDKPELALTQLDAAQALRKEPRTYNLLGVANDLVGQHDVAQRDYAEGLQLAPDNLPLRNNLGLSQALAGSFDAAIATLSAATENPKATARTRQNLALVYGLAGNSAKAASIARADLDDASVKSNLAYYAMLRGMDDRARAVAIIGAHAPMNGDQAAVPTPPAAASLAAAAPVAAPVEAVEAMPLATPAPRTPSRPKPAAHQAGPAAAGSAPPAADPPAPVLAAAASPNEAPMPAKPAAPQIAAAAQPAPPAEPAPAAATGATVVDTRPAEPAAAPQITAEPTSPPVPEPAPPVTPAAASETTEPAPQLAAAASATDEARPSAAASTARDATVKRHGFLVQVGAFRDATKAQKLCQDLVAKGYDFAVSTAHGSPAHDWFFCRSSGAADHAEAAALAQRLHAEENTAALLIPASASP